MGKGGGCRIHGKAYRDFCRFTAALSGACGAVILLSCSSRTINTLDPRAVGLSYHRRHLRSDSVTINTFDPRAGMSLSHPRRHLCFFNGCPSSKRPDRMCHFIRRGGGGGATYNITGDSRTPVCHVSTLSVFYPLPMGTFYNNCSENDRGNGGTAQV